MIIVNMVIDLYMTNIIITIDDVNMMMWMYGADNGLSHYDN